LWPSIPNPTRLQQVLLCATSVCSVSLWLKCRQERSPQRHRGHRGCTEKNSSPGALFTRSAAMIEFIYFGFYFCRKTNSVQLIFVLESRDDVADFADLFYFW